ncbi:hypothetical protein QBC43DRAFT_310766 [Cladorrhinum sp. PSN259]|nr:hypothetical protein QBC43DRAFT_310766 [Cladorrhinum sp. PSN259]
MTDRHLPSQRAIQGGGGISKTRGAAPSSRQTDSSAPNNANSVRRNLFQSQLTRRPTAGSSTSEETVRLDPQSHSSYSQSHSQSQLHHQHQHQQQQQRRHRSPGSDLPPLLSPSSSSEEADILVRTKDGEIELNDPPTPPIEDPDELEAISEQLEVEREKQRLSDAVRQYQVDRNSVPMDSEGELPSISFPSCTSTTLLKLPPLRPANNHNSSPSKGHNTANSLIEFPSTTELLEAVKVSLRAKVAALAEDNWMYEQEEVPKHQL